MSCGHHPELKRLLEQIPWYDPNLSGAALAQSKSGTTEDVLDVALSQRCGCLHPPVVADELNVTKQTARTHLGALADAGILTQQSKNPQTYEFAIAAQTPRRRDVLTSVNEVDLKKPQLDSGADDEQVNHPISGDTDALEPRNTIALLRDDTISLKDKTEQVANAVMTPWYQMSLLLAYFTVMFFSFAYIGETLGVISGAQIAASRFLGYAAFLFTIMVLLTDFGIDLVDAVYSFATGKSFRY